MCWAETTHQHKYPPGNSSEDRGITHVQRNVPLDIIDRIILVSQTSEPQMKARHISGHKLLTYQGWSTRRP